MCENVFLHGRNSKGVMSEVVMSEAVKSKAVKSDAAIFVRDK